MDGWTAGAPPELPGGYTKEVKLDQRGRLPIKVRRRRPVAAAGQEATVWFGPRTDGSPEGELAGWIKVGSLEGREGGSFWRWLDPAPTEENLENLKKYQPRTVRAGRWTTGKRPQLTDWYTKEVPIDPRGQLPFPVGGKTRPVVGVAAAKQEATVWFGRRTDEPHKGKPAAWIEVGSLEGRKGGPFWLWLDPAPTVDDLNSLQNYEYKSHRTKHADEWTAGDPPQLTDGYTKEVPLNPQGRLPFPVGGKKRPGVGSAAANQMATVWFGPRTDESHEGEPAAWIKVESLEGRKGDSFWRWLDPAPTQDDLDSLRTYENRNVDAGDWTAGDPPQLTDGDTKEIKLDPQGQLPFPVGGTPGVGSAAAGQMATVWFGPRTDESHEGEPAAWIKVESLDGREGGPFWLWLDPAPTKDELKKLKKYQPRTVHAGDWTTGDPPELTGGYTKEVPINPQGQLPFPVGGTPGVGSAAAGQMATVWFGPRTDESHEGEPAAWIKVESLKGRKGDSFWRWLDPAPTQDDLDSLRTYENRNVDAGDWTAGDPPQLTDGDTKEIKLDPQGQLPFPVGGTPGVGSAAAGQMATVWFGPRTDESHEGEPAAWIKVEGLDGREGGPFWLWLDPAPTKDELKKLKKYQPRTVHAGDWTTGDPPELTGGYTKEVKLDQQGRLPIKVRRKRPVISVAAAGQMATVWFGPRTDRLPEGELAAWIKVESLEGREGRSSWRWLDPAPTEKDLENLKKYQPRTVHAGRWTTGKRPQLTDWYTKEVKLDRRGHLPFTLDDKRRSVGVAAANEEATVWFGRRTDEPHKGKPAAWIEVGSLEGRKGGPFWLWLDPAPTKKDLEDLRTYEPAGGWTAGDPPELTGGYTKEVPINPQGQLPFRVSRRRLGFGVATAKQEATVWFGRTDGSPEGEPAAWIKVKGLKGRKGGPFWRWLDPPPTEDDLNRLKKYEPRALDAGGWTEGDPPQLTGGSPDDAVPVTPASTGSVAAAYQAEQDDAVDVPGPDTDDPTPPVDGSWARP
ncbi:hypothetical protein, partial [Micromonospora sp. NPDC048830]|uniref:hypothetical protein n=1 Tax=Micromonospora sp. NPDC048830 TaxID=3364257 RepID=UPI0037125DAF